MKNWKERQGVWVETDQGVGIRNVEKVSISDGSENGTIEIPTAYVDLVSSSGETIAARIPESSLGNVRIARRVAIPAARVAHLSAEQLARLGYA
jgi:hypothetical protein